MGDSDFDFDIGLIEISQLLGHGLGLGGFARMKMAMRP